jgi:hypothetical protein
VSGTLHPLLRVGSQRLPGMTVRQADRRWIIVTDVARGPLIELFSSAGLEGRKKLRVEGADLRVR